MERGHESGARQKTAPRAREAVPSRIASSARQMGGGAARADWIPQRVPASGHWLAEARAIFAMLVAEKYAL